MKGQALEEVDSFSYLGSEVQQTSRAEKDVKAPAEGARPSAIEATAAVQTERKEEATKRDLLAVGGCHQQRPDGDPTMARCGDRQKCMA